MKLGSTDISISPIILGTWQAGKNMWVGIDDKESIEAIRTAVQAGVTTIDTAAIYGDGYSEQIIAEALAGTPRDSVQLLTKVFPTHLAYAKVKESCEASLRRLRTDYIDLLQIHWPSGAFGSAIVPIDQTLEAFVELKAAGKIRAIGVSNFSAEQIAVARRYAPIESNQPPYSLFWRQSEDYAIRYSQQEGISTLAYSPLAQGMLTGKFGAGHRFDPADNRNKNLLAQPAHFARVQETLSQLSLFAAGKGITLAQLALAWVTSQPNCAAIAGARNPQQALANASALRISLDAADIADLNLIAQHVNEHVGSDPQQWRAE